MTGALRLRLLGPVQAEWNGEVIHDFGSRKALALLGYLASAPGPVSRTSLVDLFWQDKAESSGRRNLSWVLSTISSRLPDVLKTDRYAVSFDDDSRHWTDIGALENASRAGDIPTLSAAVSLYRGDFMEGFFLAGCPDFETWLLAERERWQQRIAEALKRLIGHHMGQNHFGVSRELGTQLLTLQPWSEEAHRFMMRLLALSGQRSAALLQFERCRRLLDSELNVAPSPATVALYDEILRGELVPADEAQVEGAPTLRPVLHNVPTPLTPLLGRENAVAEIRGQLAREDCRILSLVGPGGIGKTRLALEVAADQIGHFADGVFFVPLATVTGRDVLLTAVARAVGFSFYIQETAPEQMLSFFRDKELLLVLDNFEHLLDEAPVIGSWLEHAPRLKVLVTSQARLGYRGERVYEVHGLDYPPEGTRAGLERYSAVRLFVDGARRADPAFTLDGENGVAVGRICRLVDGSPLGLELASSWVSVLTSREIVTHLEANLATLEASLQDLPRRQRSLQAAFDHSWSLLTAEEQAALKRISVFRGGFEREAAEQVAGCSLTAIQALVHRSFLRRTAPGRYEMHESLRQSAAVRLARDRQVATETVARHGRYYAAYVDARSAELKGGRQRAALAEIGAELDNIRAGWRWVATSGDLPMIAIYLPGLFHFYDMRSWFAEGADAFRLGADAAREAGAERLWARLTARQGWFTFHSGRHVQAQVLLRRSLQALEKIGAVEEIPFCLNYLSAIIRFLGYHHDALALVERSIALCREIEDYVNLSIALNVRGSIAYSLGEYAEADRYCRESLALKESLNDRWGAAFSITMLGRVALESGQLETARSLLQNSLAYRAAVDDRRGMAINLNLLGQVAEAAGRPNEAGHFYRDSLGITRVIGDRWTIINSLRHLAALKLAAGDRAAARRLYREALQTAADIRATTRTLQLVSALAPLAAADETEAAVLLNHVFINPESAPDLKQSVAEQLALMASRHPPGWLDESRHASELLSLKEVVERLTAPNRKPGR